jgi:20S proteasome alpha/beta subunit
MPDGDDDMTVGIGALCEYGDCVVIASDTRVTFRGMRVDPHDKACKQYDFAPFVIGATIAGSTSSTHAVISELSGQLQKIIQAKLRNPQGEVAFEHVRNCLEAARKRELRRLQDCEMQAELGISLDQWLAGRLPDGRPFNEYAHY